MATILTKKSDTSSSVPLAADLTNAAGGAELAVNTADKRLYSKTSGGSVVELGTNPSALSLPNGTANGVPYLNGSKVLTSGSALSFDGSGLGVNTAAVSGYKLTVGGTGNFFASASLGRVFLGDPTDTAGYVGLYRSDAGPTNFNTGGNYLNFASLAGYTWNIGLAAYGSQSEQMRLTSTGLGIGTSSPVGKLHVVGTSYINVGAYATGYALTLGASSETSRTYQIGMVTGGNLAIYDSGAAATRLVLDTSGNLGLGVTPSAWGGNFKALQINGLYGGALSTSAASNTFTNLSHSAYHNGTNWVYGATGFGAARYEIDGPAGGATHKWYTAPSGTAGNAISFTQALTLDASGNLLLGTTFSPSTGAGTQTILSGVFQNVGTAQTIAIANGVGGIITITSVQGGIGSSTWTIPLVKRGGSLAIGTPSKAVLTSDPISSVSVSSGNISVAPVAANTYFTFSIQYTPLGS